MTPQESTADAGAHDASAQRRRRHAVIRADVAEEEDRAGQAEASEGAGGLTR